MGNKGSQLVLELSAEDKQQISKPIEKGEIGSMQFKVLTQEQMNDKLKLERRVSSSLVKQSTMR